MHRIGHLILVILSFLLSLFVFFFYFFKPDTPDPIDTKEALAICEERQNDRINAAKIDHLCSYYGITSEPCD